MEVVAGKIYVEMMVFVRVDIRFADHLKAAEGDINQMSDTFFCRKVVYLQVIDEIGSSVLSFFTHNLDYSERLLYKEISNEFKR